MGTYIPHDDHRRESEILLSFVFAGSITRFPHSVQTNAHIAPGISVWSCHILVVVILCPPESSHGATRVVLSPQASKRASISLE